MGFSPLISTYWRRKHWTSLFASVTYIGAEVVPVRARINLGLDLAVSALIAAVLAAFSVRAGIPSALCT